MCADSLDPDFSPVRCFRKTELGKRPIPTRRQGDTLNTKTYRGSLLSRKPNSYQQENQKDKREDNLIGHSLLLFDYSENIQLASSPGWDRHRATRPGCIPGCDEVASPSLSFSLPPRQTQCRVSETTAATEFAIESTARPLFLMFHCGGNGVGRT